MSANVSILMKKRRIHDGIAGGLITLGAVLGYYFNPLWIILAGLIGVLMLQSAFTKFCPVYYTLDKILPTSTEPITQ